MRFGITQPPVALVMTAAVLIPCVSLIRSTRAPATMAPDGSRTHPVTVPSVICASAKAGARNKAATRPAMLQVLRIITSPPPIFMDRDSAPGVDTLSFALTLSTHETRLFTRTRPLHSLLDPTLSLRAQPNEQTSLRVPSLNGKRSYRTPDSVDLQVKKHKNVGRNLRNRLSL